MFFYLLAIIFIIIIIISIIWKLPVSLYRLLQLGFVPGEIDYVSIKSWAIHGNFIQRCNFSDNSLTIAQRDVIGGVSYRRIVTMLYRLLKSSFYR